MFPIENLREVIKKTRWNRAPANKHEAVHFKFSRPTSVMISWILLVTNEGGAVPDASNLDRKSVFYCIVSSESPKYHSVQSKSEWDVGHSFQGTPCLGSLLLKTRTRKPLRNVLHWAVEEISNWYHEYEIDLQSEIKSTRYAPGSLKSAKYPTADSASARMGSPFSCAS